MQISNEIIESYFECNYKSHLKLKGIQGEKGTLEKFLLSEAQSVKETFLNNLLNTDCEWADGSLNHNLEQIITQKNDYIINANIHYEDFSFYSDLLKKIPLKSKFGDFSYAPILIVATENIPRKSKILIAGIAYILNKIQAVTTSSAEIIYGWKHRAAKIKIETYLKEFHKITGQLRETDKFAFHLNNHCSICEFSKHCREKAIAEDHLSLLRGITRDRIKELNNKGIFSINQLSYTFRPKRKQAKNNTKNKTRSVELQALAIREQKIFIYDTPAQMPKSPAEIYLDIEGIPEHNSYYLIGFTVKHDERVQHHHFWANNREEELTIVQEFLKRLLTFADFTVYHYGTYEATFLKKMQAKLSPAYHDVIDQILSRCYNVLSVLYTHIYFPTYSNSLKEIGPFIGFNWSMENATGIESIFWRRSWELSKDPLLKEKLITYNQEDCTVLMNLKDVIHAVIENNSERQIGKVKDLEKAQKTTFIVHESFFPELKFINECAYFDYQREKVYTKTNPSIKKAQQEKAKKKKHIYDFKPGKTVNIKRDCCAQCKSESIYTSKILSRQIVDLNFTKTGVKVFVTRYNSCEYACMTCKHRFIPPGYPQLRLKLGHNLITWVIYQHIVNKQGFRVISDNFRELFHLSISGATFFACKDYFMRFYEATYQNLLNILVNSAVLYVDETPFTMQFEKGYVWVFTNGSEVISLYKPNREAGFLKDFLKDFNGVLVTDFYNGYDSLDCPQQKCLIHLIRDFNSDLIRNPFNEEFKTVAREFTTLLQKIVAAINRFGLKQYHLNQYKKEANRFFKKALSSVYQTEIAQQYQNRIKRNRETLFEFLNHDNVSWNNSNAEHAIKILALHANKNINSFRKSKIEDYLKIMSIYQTCEYKNISFLKFLLSKKTILNDF